MVLLRAAGNRHAILAIENARVMTHMFGYRNDTPSTWSDPAAFGRVSLSFHIDVYEAIRQRDPKAALRTMAAHMRQTRKHLLARYDWMQRQNKLDDRWLDEFPESMREAVQDIQRRAAADSPIAAGDGVTASPTNQQCVSIRKPRGMSPAATDRLVTSPRPYVFNPIADQNEGRTAVSLRGKHVRRRDFLLKTAAAGAVGLCGARSRR